MILMNPIKIYLSHSIRGKNGLNATAKEQAANCAKAIMFAQELRKRFPDIELYVPAESEPFVGMAYWHEYLTEEQILFIDCEIISQREGMIIYAPDNHISRGMQVEIEYCKQNKIPYLLVNEQLIKICKSMDVNYLNIINNFLVRLVKEIR